MSQAGPFPAGSAAAGNELSPAQRSKIRRLSQQSEPSPGEDAGELNIIPYLDIITNILVFVLATVSVTFLTQLDTQPPSLGGSRVKQAPNPDALNLSVLITDKGVAFKTGFGSISTGCEGAGAGITVPMNGDAYDADSIKRCARKLKSEAGNGKFEDETQVTVTASRDIEYRHVIEVLDALRGDQQGELFPEFHLGVAK